MESRFHDFWKTGIPVIQEEADTLTADKSQNWI